MSRRSGDSDGWLGGLTTRRSLPLGIGDASEPVRVNPSSPLRVLDADGYGCGVSLMTAIRSSLFEVAFIAIMQAAIFQLECYRLHHLTSIPRAHVRSRRSRMPESKEVCLVA